MNPAHDIKVRLDAGEFITLDAGTGTELQARGVPMHPAVWCGMAHVDRPDVCRAIHIDYINAGADIITTNTFSTNRNMMGPAGLGEDAMKSTRQAAQIAIEARQLANAERPIAVAGSMSHQVPINQGTNKRKQDVLPDIGKARENFIEMAETLTDAGVDMIICEMMSDTNLSVPCVEAAVATGLPVWVGLSTDMIDGRLMSHTFHDMPFEEVIETVLACGGEVAGVMHSKIPTILPAIDLIRRAFTGPVMAYPDSGSFSMPDWQFEGVTTPEAFAKEVETWKAHGVQVIGGCCGMGVDHIHALHG